jgi:hypothetical protein
MNEVIDAGHDGTMTVVLSRRTQFAITGTALSDIHIGTS